MQAGGRGSARVPWVANRNQRAVLLARILMHAEMVQERGTQWEPRGAGSSARASGKCQWRECAKRPRRGGLKSQCETGGDFFGESGNVQNCSKIGDFCRKWQLHDLRHGGARKKRDGEFFFRRDILFPISEATLRPTPRSREGISLRFAPSQSVVFSLDYKRSMRRTFLIF